MSQEWQRKGTGCSDAALEAEDEEEEGAVLQGRDEGRRAGWDRRVGPTQRLGEGAAPRGSLPAPVTPSAAPPRPRSPAAGSITAPAALPGHIPIPPGSAAPGTPTAARVPRPIGAGSAPRCDVEQLLGATQPPGGSDVVPTQAGSPRSQPADGS